jgi:hypothetical protein
MFRHRRNNALAGIVMLNGVILMAFGSSLPWGEFEYGGSDKPTLPYAGHHVFGFDQTITSNGSVTDFGPVILIVSGVVALCALALFLTRVRGLGALWRVVALGSLVPVALVIGSLWSIFDETPGNDLARTDSAPVRAFGVAMNNHAVSSSVGPGLLLTTLGFGVAVVGSLIPAFRSKQAVREHKDAPKYGDWLAPQATASS